MLADILPGIEVFGWIDCCWVDGEGGEENLHIIVVHIVHICCMYVYMNWTYSDKVISVAGIALQCRKSRFQLCAIIIHHHD